MRRIVVLGVLILALVITGCGSSSDDGSAAAPSDDGSAAAPSDGGSAAAISLPDGWAMTDAISADEVGAITGKTMEVFPEASSAAQSGKPAGGFTAAAVDDSKIYFGADVQGGEAVFEDTKSYAEGGSVQDVSGVGDAAYYLTFSDGRAGVVAIKGDAVIRVDWNPAVYTEDPAGFGAELANLLLGKMFQ